MDILLILLAAITAYLIGSIPTAVWIGKRYYGIDVRDYGSGNAGATNTFRVLGKRAGIIVMLLDSLKGFIATSLATLLIYIEIVSFDEFILYKTIFYKLIFGLLAVVGHIFPVFAGFKGGKGVATLLGMMLAVDTEITLLCVFIFLVVLFASKYVSLGSILATLAFPLLLLIPRFKPDDPIVIIFGFVMFAIVVLTHQKNVGRLWRGEESRVNIKLKLRKH